MSSRSPSPDGRRPNRLPFVGACCAALLLFARPAVGVAQGLRPPQAYQPQRLKAVVIGEATAGTLAFAGLNFLWYKKFPKSRFHFFNDNQEWLQMDKVGHATTAYTLAVMQHDLMRWSGVREGPSILIGSLTALAYMSTIEVMDGFSLHWGFSPGDMLANLSGITLFAGQQLEWGEQRLALRFSFHYSPFAKYNPRELGDNWRSRIIKDYNGQTYWLSLNMHALLPFRNAIPCWLNAAVGYGAEGMLAARANPRVLDGDTLPAYRRYRQVYLSADMNWSRLSSAGPLALPLEALRFLKVPFPALEWSENHLLWHGLYY